MKFHWKNPFFLGNLFVHRLFPVPWICRAHLEHGKASPHVLDKRYVDFSVIMFFPQMFLQSCMNHEKPFQFRNQIKPYRTISHISLFFCHYAGLPGFSALTKCSPRVPGRHHCGSTAVPQQKRRPNAKPRP